MLLSPHFRFLIKRGVSKVTCTDAALLPRGCTDVICCVLLFLAIVGYVAVGIVGEPREGRGLRLLWWEGPGRHRLWGTGWYCGYKVTEPQCPWVSPQPGPMETLGR